jgi:hypothetical protein
LGRHLSLLDLHLLLLHRHLLLKDMMLMQHLRLLLWVKQLSWRQLHIVRGISTTVLRVLVVRRPLAWHRYPHRHLHLVRNLLWAAVLLKLLGLVLLLKMLLTLGPLRLLLDHALLLALLLLLLLGGSALSPARASAVLTTVDA